jgi:hypothetical protein
VRALPSLAAAVVLLAAAAARAEISEAEGKAREDAAKALVAFSARCAKVGDRAAAAAAAAEAREMDHLVAGLKEAEAAVEAMPAGAPPVLEFSRERTDAAKAVAKVFDRLAAMKHDAKEDARFDDYALRALRWDPSDARVKRAVAAAEAAAGGNRPEAAGLLLRGILRADPEGDAKGRYDALVERLAQKDPLFLGSPGHDLMAWVSLPRGWKKGKSCPILVAVDGAGCSFLGAARQFATSRGSRPFVVVSPATLSNTNALDPAKYPAYPKALLERWNGDRIGFDGPGVDAVLAEVRKRFGGEEGIFVTGFSGGGNYCYWKTIADPAGVRGAAPACANFSGMGVADAPGPGAAGGPPIHIFTGEKDPHRDFTFGKKDSPGIEPQTDFAVKTLKEKGFTRVERTMVKGAGHSSLAAQVWEFVDGVLGGK